MSYGIIEYENGKPVCEICRRSFHRVMTHVRQVHEMTEREYKAQFGFEHLKGICSQASSEKTRIKTMQNYDTVIAKNLIKNGEKSRFKPESKGRTKDQVSEELRIKLYNRLSEPYMRTALQKSGKKLGETGLGNKARWEKDI